MASSWFAANDGLLINLDNAEFVEKQEVGARIVYTSGRIRRLVEANAFSRIRKRLFWNEPADDVQKNDWATEWNEEGV